MFLFGKKHTSQKASVYDKLSEKWTTRHRTLKEKLWTKHAAALKHAVGKSKQFAAGSIAAAILLATPASKPTSITPPVLKEKLLDLDKSTSLLVDLHGVLPSTVQPLTPEQETKVEVILSSAFNLPITAELQGIRLNRSYGYIGQEQHLSRFPGDTIDTHFSTGEDAQKYYDYGMAPGLGAYGYFAKSTKDMTTANLREKYYIAVQTFLAPGYLENTKKMNDFFAFRKMLVVNPDNGKAVVADIGDSGPSEWTGKALGGSPEVMQYLERVDGADKGPVIYMFIDDPNDKIPLGPVTL